MLRQLIAILVLPFVALVVIPAVLIYTSKQIQIGCGLAAPAACLPVVSGVILVAAGLFLMGHTIALFATIGKGTLAPWDPPTKLVVRGIYRHVRNPMISGVLCILLGEVLILGSSALAIWFAIFMIANLIYLPVFEEPKLDSRFGKDYMAYRKNVPRWIPRKTAWTLEESSED